MLTYQRNNDEKMLYRIENEIISPFFDEELKSDFEFF